MPIAKPRHEDEQLFRTLVETVTDYAIFSLDPSGVVRTWNAGAERIFGYTAEEMIGAPIETIIPAERRDEEVSILARLRLGERIEHFESIRRAK
ncbi:PAS domain S-box protein, partial [Salmonella enterica subsp. enterica serovar Minnesota]|uniref:PAS domain S-box protein n=1 Tax=Salmonella enterica TaxID=28901 RepID=UPI003D2CAFB5